VIAWRCAGVVAESLDFLRREMAQRLKLVPENTYNFLWIIDTPMFEYSPEQGRFDAMHHPFCLPNPQDMPLLEAGSTVKCRWAMRLIRGRRCARGCMTWCSTAASWPRLDSLPPPRRAGKDLQRHRPAARRGAGAFRFHARCL
jgi:hypothetical protein